MLNVCAEEFVPSWLSNEAAQQPVALLKKSIEYDLVPILGCSALGTVALGMVALGKAAVGMVARGYTGLR